VGKYAKSGFWAKCGIISALLISTAPAGMGETPVYGAGKAELTASTAAGMQTDSEADGDTGDGEISGEMTGTAGVEKETAGSAGGTAPEPEADAGMGQAAHAEILELEQGCTVELKDASVRRTGASTVWTMAVEVTNGSVKDIRLEDYYFRVRAGTGASMKASLMPEDQDALVVLPGESAVYRFYGVGSENVTAEALSLEIGRWDFGSADYEKPVGSLSGVNVSGGRTEGMADAGGLELTATASAAVQRSSGKFMETAITLKLQNEDASPVRLPDWQLWLELKDGSRYSVTANGLKAGGTVPAGTDLNAALNVSVPAGKDLTDAKLSFTRPAPTPGVSGSGSTIQVPAGWAKLRTEALSVGESGESRSVASTEGAYTLTLESLQRWPWEDTDLLTATVTVAHAMDTAMPMPSLSGKFRTGSAPEWKAEVIPENSSRMLQPGQQAKLYMQIRLSPDEAASDWELVLQENVKQDGGDYMVDRAVWEGAALTPVPEIKSGQANLLSCSAGQWSCTVNGMERYEGSEGFLVAIQVEAVNLDKRYTAPAQWVAQLVTEDGTVYPAQVESANRKVVPHGKAALSVWAPLPYGVETDGMKLLMGLAVTGGKLSGPGDKPDSFLKAALYEVPAADKKVESSLDAIALFPYTLKISDMHTPFWYYNEFTFEFDYELKKDLTVVSETKDKRFIIEVLDADGKAVHEEAYALALDSTGSTGGASTQSLKLGSDTIKWKEKVENYSGNITSYTLRVYEEFRPGYRKLLAEKKIN
jgi:hypothetical protein